MSGVDVKGSWERTRKATFRLPEPVITFLKLKSITEDKSMEDLLLEALKAHFKIGAV
ncbi:MAG: hypothetical protein KJ886_02955 [Candidatus Thermoplasmatota archaeon]|nr:hypothetical protein [Candidatus Thermoplasmatota archaeon]MBU4256169.1 hypothetical protein [Candidatus Thermoplasmatota archaeon]MCG2825423.1 hypothetical protein [Thermoplasmatales archaeon]